MDFSWRASSDFGPKESPLILKVSNISDANSEALRNESLPPTAIFHQSDSQATVMAKTLEHSYSAGWPLLHLVSTTLDTQRYLTIW
jgi:hypothetical protein